MFLTIFTLVGDLDILLIHVMKFIVVQCVYIADKYCSTHNYERGQRERFEREVEPVKSMKRQLG